MTKTNTLKEGVFEQAQTVLKKSLRDIILENELKKLSKRESKLQKIQEEKEIIRESRVIKIVMFCMWVNN